MRSLLSTLAISLVLSACGGGGGSSSGTVFEGTLTQTGPGHKSHPVTLKHAVGTQIENVKICILGACSITDGKGQWGVHVENFVGGEVIVAIDGHGILTTASTSIPSTAKDVVMDLGRDGNTVTIIKLVIDGEDHSGHDHVHRSQS